MLNIFIAAMFAYGMFTLQRPGFLLDFMRPFWKKIAPKGLHEPLFECGVCVSSIWGGSCFIYLNLFTQWYYMIPVAMIASSGMLAIVDRAVKAFEKHYGYKAAGASSCSVPQVEAKQEKSWEYLVDSEALRSILIEGFIHRSLDKNHYLIEIGGKAFYTTRSKYQSFNDKHRLTAENMPAPYMLGYVYDVVILGLYFEGNLVLLKNLIKNARRTYIEYSKDGESLKQLEFLTKDMNVKILIPEYTLPITGKAPAECGSVTTRSVVMLESK